MEYGHKPLTSLDELSFINPKSLATASKSVALIKSSIIEAKQIGNEDHVWEVLNVLEFDSDRKRMSVIVRHSLTGKLTL